MNAKTLIFFFLIVFFTTISIIKFTKALQAQIYYNKSRTENPYNYNGIWYSDKSKAEEALFSAHPGAEANGTVSHDDDGEAYIYRYTTTARPNASN
uniref:DUF4828 domain-containing protein n=1 Tax=Parastrongyloides trichosuri TaxID=131310 RepID=A0A0N5A297_PARTI